MFEIAIKGCKKTVSWAIAVTLALTVSIPFYPPTPAEAASAVVPRVFSAPEELGTMVTTPNTLHSAYGVEDGRDVLYTTVTGSASSPAIFSVVDLKSYTLLREFQLEGGGQSWGHVLDSQGNVYIASGPKLFVYSPATRKVASLGTVPGAGTLYNLVVDEKDVVYGGAYPTGKVFKYDPAQKAITNYEPFTADAGYAKTIEYYKGELYVGEGSKGALYKMNPATGAKTQIPLPPNDVFDAAHAPMVYTMNIAGHYLFILMSSTPNTLLIYDLEKQQFLADKIISNYRGMFVSPERNGKVYFPANGEFQTFDLATEEIKPTGLAFGTYLRNSEWVDIGDPELPGKSLVTVMFGGQVVASNFESMQVKTLTPVVSGTPVSIQSLIFGPDRLLYTSGYQGTYAARYNIETAEKELFNMGQSEGMIAWEDKVIFGEYPAAYIHELDTKQPLLRGENPKKIHEIGSSQDRPFALETGEGKLFVGTVPKIGLLGGALSVYDGSKWETYRNLIQDQSIMGLVYRDGKLYGSTTVWGGLDIAPTDSEAKMFVWDVAKKELITTFTPDIAQAGGKKAKAIGNLSFGPDGLLWGAAYGTIFAIDPVTYKTVKQKEIVPTDWVYDHVWTPVKLQWDAEGILYTTLGSKLVAIDTKTMAHTVIPGTKTNLMALGPDGNLYYSEASMLKRVKVKKEQPPVYADVEIPVMNGSFEQVNADGTIPGWESFGQRNAAADYQVSQEKANHGSKSLRLTDTSAAAEAGVISIPFSVEPGFEYTAKSDIYLDKGRTIFAMKFYDADGKEISLSPAPAVYHTGPSKTWKTAEFSSMAPAGAVTAKLVLFCSTAWETDSYYDNVRVVKLTPSDAPPTGPALQQLDVPNPGFEHVNTDGTIPGWTIRDPQTLKDKTKSDIKLSDAVVKDGLNSLYLLDNDTTLTVAADGDLIPVAEGVTYTIAADVYRTDPPAGRSSNRPYVQIRYYNEAKKEMTPVAGTTMSLEATAALKQWDTLSFSNTAPKGAKYIGIKLVSSAAFVASAYYDNVTLSTVVAPEKRTAFQLDSTPLSHTAEGTNLSFRARATLDSTIVVKENGRTVATAAGAGENSPVTVTVPAPAAGNHRYTVYANMEGYGKSAAMSLPSVTVHPLSDLQLSASRLAMSPGQSAAVVAKAVYGHIVYDITPQLALSAGPEGVVTIAGNTVTAAADGQVALTASYGGHSKEVTVSVSSPILDSIGIELSKAQVAKGESVTAQVYGLYKSAGSDQAERRPLSGGVTLTAEPANLVTIDNMTVTGMAEGNTVVKAVYAGHEAFASLQIAKTGEPGPVDPTDPTNPTDSSVPESITMALSGTQLEVGQTVTATVYGYYTGMSAGLPLSDGVALSPLSEGIVRVNGLSLTGIGSGSTVVTAVYKGIAASTIIKVKAPVPYVPPTAPSVPAPEPEKEMPKGRLNVTDEQLKPQDGKATIALGPETNEVLLPIRAAELLKDGVLEISSQSVTLQVPAALLAEVADKLGASGDRSARIALNAKVLSEQQIAQIAAKIQGDSSLAGIRPAGSMIQLELAVVTADGKRTPYSSFTQPVRVRIAIGKDSDARLLGIYYIGENGKLEYVGGRRSGDALEAELSHFSTYAVLKYERSYADVPAAHWANEAIRTLSAKHVVEGVTSTDFAPSQTLTRAQFVTMLVRAFGIGEAEKSANAFADIRESDWYYASVQAAVKSGIVQGVDAGRFDPNAAVTREQMAVMLVRAWESVSGALTEKNDLAAFQDAPQVSGWAAREIGIAVQRGWMQGQGDGRLAPLSGATRAESAQMLVNVMERAYK
ncbi:S-layer homology domain-containing protein [Paenibacillus sp. MBLB4367]|uniref:S-layer homology domain-containing protein n=1 Tax=Paenibacillus sp. MBLB4367 TaxID=3384767 RepID=UPI0039082CCC